MMFNSLLNAAHYCWKEGHLAAISFANIAECLAVARQQGKWHVLKMYFHFGVKMEKFLAVFGEEIMSATIRTTFPCTTRAGSCLLWELKSPLLEV